MSFSEHSYGFRPGRRAHDAVLAAQSYEQSGRRIVVDVDLEKFFDRGNHDILIDRLHKRIGDPGVIRLIRAYLNAGVMRELDEWVRHRLRAIQLKHWKRGPTMYGELRALGAAHDVARQVAANSHRWWRNSGKLLNSVLPIAWFDRLGCPVSPDLNFPNPPGADPHARWCGRGVACWLPPMPIGAAKAESRMPEKRGGCYASVSATSGSRQSIGGRPASTR